MIERNRIIGVHLLNDFSGSPFVFSQALQSLQQKGFEVHLFTATPSGRGFLSGINKITVHPIFYQWSAFKVITLLFFCTSQCLLFFRLLFFLHRSDIVYINSMLPFGAALAGALRRCDVVYHVHEVSIQPPALRRFLLQVIHLTATRCLYVSQYLRQHTMVSQPGVVVYNSLPEHFIREAAAHHRDPSKPFVVLMLCSLKRYKGVFEFIACARSLSDVAFELVLNASQKEIDAFFADFELPRNITLFPAQKDVHPFYRNASIVVNLSLPNEWVETFGMTILEAMYYKLPVIVPPLGGITELVEEGVNGFQVDPHNIKALRDKITFLATSRDEYNRMSFAAARKARAFSPQAFRSSIEEQFFVIAQSHDPYRENSLFPH